MRDSPINCKQYWFKKPGSRSQWSTYLDSLGAQVRGSEGSLAGVEQYITINSLWIHFLLSGIYLKVRVCVLLNSVFYTLAQGTPSEAVFWIEERMVGWVHVPSLWWCRDCTAPHLPIPASGLLLAALDMPRLWHAHSLLLVQGPPSLPPCCPSCFCLEWIRSPGMSGDPFSHLEICCNPPDNLVTIMFREVSLEM